MSGTTHNARRGTSGEWAGVVCRFTRLIVLGAAGYGVFAVGVGLYYAISLRYSQHDPFVVYWLEGLLLSLLFASTEFLNSGRGRSVGFTRRLLVSACIMVLSILLAIVLRDANGWRTKQQPDHWYYVGHGLVVLFFVVGCVLMHGWWRQRTTEKTGDSAAQYND